MIRALGPDRAGDRPDVVLLDRSGGLDVLELSRAGRGPASRWCSEIQGLLGQVAVQRGLSTPDRKTRRSWRRVLAAGVRKLPAGLITAQRAMELANEDATMEMEHRTTYLATVGTLGPMIGLVGTVYGMILSFRVIAVEGSSPQASQLAAGHLDGAVRHARGDRAVDPGDLFLCVVPEPDRAAVAGGGDDRRACSSSSSRRAYGCRRQPPMPPPARSPHHRAPAHAHPFAVSAALAAASAARRGRPCQPSDPDGPRSID